MYQYGPSSREDLIQYVLRRLGHPVVKVNVSRSQIEDLVDDAIQMYVEYCSDGMQRGYLNHKITQEEIDRQTAEPPSFTGPVQFINTKTPNDNNAQCIIRVPSGGLVQMGFLNGYTIDVSDTASNDGQYTIASVTDTEIRLVGSNRLANEDAAMAKISAFNVDGGGFIELHPSILNVSGMFLLTNTNLSSGMFSVQYQFMLNNIHEIAYGNLIYYETTRQYLNMMQFMFSGDKQIRFRRNSNRLYIDISWKNMFKAGDYIFIDCYRAMDPESYPGIYNEIFVKKYLTALVKRQWGENLKKFSGVSLMGGVTMNGQIMWDEADKEVKKLEDEVIKKYSEPVDFFVG